MKTKSEFKNRLYGQFNKLLTIRTVALLLCNVVANNVAFSGVVTNCAEADLRVAMAGGGMVTFACDGTIMLTNTIVVGTDVILDGSGHHITISGGNQVRVFYVNPNINLTLNLVTVANGAATNDPAVTLFAYGGAIYNDGGTVNAINCVFFGNGALGSAPPVPGFPSQGGNGYGGAIYNVGVLNADYCSFLQNLAVGGAGFSYIFVGAEGRGNGGGWGGIAQGGAIYNLGAMTITRSLFASNTASGGRGGQGQDGSPALYEGPNDGGAGGVGGDSAGGALYNGGSACSVNCTFAWNACRGGNGGNGGSGTSYYHRGQWYSANGGNGGNGGQSLGVIYSTTSLLHLTNCTIAFNSASGGNGGSGGSSGGQGGAGMNGIAGTKGSAYGCIQATGGELLNTLLASNLPQNCAGTITDAGYNLSSDGSCSFTGIGSMMNTDPNLGPLADNGGPTLTMALLPGSPAIDAGDNAAAPPTDQRGFPRPVGLAADIGACECGPPAITTSPPTQTVELNSTISLWVDIAGEPAMSYLWFCNGTDLIGSGTNCELVLTTCQYLYSGTYTVVVTNLYGAVSSTPFQLNIIPPVVRRPVPGINLMGDVGSTMHLDYASTLGPVPNWSTLGSVSLMSSSQIYFDLTEPLPPQRFYRVWQTGTPSTLPSLTLPAMVPAITLTGNVGDQFRLDYINQFGPTDAWVTLDTVTLTNASQLYFDVSAIGQPPRLWRIVPVH